MENVDITNLISALNNTSKGRIKYDLYWHIHGRTQHILDEISEDLTRLSINLITSPVNAERKQKSIPPAEKVKIFDPPVVKPKDQPKQEIKNEDCEFVRHHNEKELSILEYEEEQSKLHQKLFEDKQQEFQNFTQNLDEKIHSQYIITKERQVLDNLQKEAELHQIEQINLRNIEINPKSKSAYERVNEAKSKQEQLQKELEREREHEALILQIQQNHQTFLFDLLPLIEAKLSKCEEKDVNNYEDHNRLTSILNRLNEATLFLSLESITEADLVTIKVIIEEANKLLCDIDSSLEEAESKTISSEIPETLATREWNNGGSRTDSRLSNIDEMEECVEVAIEEDNADYAMHNLQETVEEYLRVTLHLKKFEASLRPFATNPQHKKYRFELHKTVTTPINAISGSSGTHLKDKILKLVSLLSGRPVLSAGKSVSCNQDPLALDYCKNLIAKKFVSQGEEQVASQPTTAFPVATAIVAVCSKYPDLWILLLGHFYTRCPYLVPFHPPREENQSDKDFFMKLGYKSVDDKLEEKDKFLKRMSGFMRLYAAILQSSPPPGFPVANIHGIEFGWTWISRVLNVEPQPDVTATLLLDMLETAGHLLGKTYNKQFRKLLHVLCKEYYDNIKNITSATSLGPVARLEDFLQTTIRKGHIKSPNGALSSNFWRT